jgi:hypothetical protein
VKSDSWEALIAAKERKERKEKTKKNLTQSRKGAKGRQQPRMNQPSREAMAGKLRIYADGFSRA